MKISIKERSIIRPSKETPQRKLWISDMDLLVSRYHVPLVYFYKQNLNNECLNFFKAKVLKDALSDVLVPFYPLAGRLGEDENGRIQINCNGNGVLFIEAETTSVIDDFGDFAPSSDYLQLVPSFDSFSDIFSYPIFAAQLTRFSCGSVCVGVCVHHIAVDGIAASHFMNSWSDVARGISIVTPPVIDRTLIDARIPPTPIFHHSEYDPPPAMMNSILSLDSKPTTTKMFMISPNQLSALKSKFKNYSTYEILSTHIWYCVCKARDLSNDQVTKLYIPTNGRSRFDPPLPPGFFGNAQFITTLTTSAGEIQSRPLMETMEKIHLSIKKMDDRYLRSAIDYLKMQTDLSVLRRGANTFKCPNLDIVSWTQIPFHNANFGWGSPIYVGRAKVAFEGMAYITRSVNNDDSLSVVICLHINHMERFERLFYDFTHILKEYSNL